MKPSTPAWVVIAGPAALSLLVYAWLFQMPQTKQLDFLRKEAGKAATRGTTSPGDSAAVLKRKLAELDAEESRLQSAKTALLRESFVGAEGAAISVQDTLTRVAAAGDAFRAQGLVLDEETYQRGASVPILNTSFVDKNATVRAQSVPGWKIRARGTYLLTLKALQSLEKTDPALRLTSISMHQATGSEALEGGLAWDFTFSLDRSTP